MNFFCPSVIAGEMNYNDHFPIWEEDIASYFTYIVL